ncbi:Oidioi.mRNA.OKI2018_I69.PAR.g8828.t1.cds [Oikopleura dioica]|uniref:Oidioi.mRNA.OKI2018_I69.PAR.g8828.t1.cds n=1 Tax=Oikopleura dioica TaxID=34765 RepID=A0ABN7RHT4_OIKDI|nr:Oidioi.mRNA.OKI2018_I69.PAR.g8828.t1.cds [Oikopleura dioica]
MLIPKKGDGQEGSVVGLTIGVIVVFWIVIGNAFTIYGLLRFKPPRNSSGSERRRRITYHYLFSNAVADLLIGIIVTPLALYQEFNEWPSAVPCKFWITLDITCCTASCLSLMIISLDRWFTCKRPIPPKWYTDRRADQVIVIVWIISVTVSALTVHSVDEENQLMLRSRLFNQSDSMRWECVASFSPFYAICSATVSFIIPGIIIVVSNIGIITVSAKLNERNRKRMLSSPAGMLKRKNPRAAQQIAANDRLGPLFSISEPLCSKAPSLDVSKALSSSEKNRRERRLNRTCTLISICFVFCWLPFSILQSVRSVFPSTFDGVNIIFDITIWLGWGNSALNPAEEFYSESWRGVLYLDSPDEVEFERRKRHKWPDSTKIPDDRQCAPALAGQKARKKKIARHSIRPKQGC